MCGCGGKCHCMMGEIAGVMTSMEDAYDYAVATLKELDKALDPCQIAILEAEYEEAWEEIEYCEGELGETVNQFLDNKEYNEWYFQGWYYENRRIYRIAR